jgi:hypothetical protein
MEASYFRRTKCLGALHRGKRSHAPRETLGIRHAPSDCRTFDERDKHQEGGDGREEYKREFLHPD